MSENKTVTFDAMRDIRDLIPDLYAYAAQHDDRNILESRVLAVYDVIDNAKCEQPAAQSAGQEAVPVGRVQVGDGSIMFIPDADAWRMGDEYEVFANAAPVNGGERAYPDVSGKLQKGDMRVKDGRVWHCSDPDIDRWVSNSCDINIVSEAGLPFERAADAPQVGSSFEFNHVGHLHTVYGDDAAIKALLQYRKHLEDVTANALKRAALSSPAKAGEGDEILPGEYTNADDLIAALNGRDAREAFEQLKDWPGMRPREIFYAGWRAALSADASKAKEVKHG